MTFERTPVSQLHPGDLILVASLRGFAVRAVERVEDADSPSAARVYTVGTSVGPVLYNFGTDNGVAYVCKD